MRNINEVMLSGNTVSAPTVRDYNDSKFVDLTIASNRKAYQDKDGNWTNGVDYVPVSLSGKMAQRVAELPKGSKITLRGSIESYKYTKDDQNVYGLRVHAEEIISVEPKTEKTAKNETTPF